MDKPEKTKTTSIRIDKDLRADLEAIAKKENRTLNNLIGVALAAYVRSYKAKKGI